MKTHNPGCNCCGSTPPVDAQCCPCFASGSGTTFNTLPGSLANSDITLTMDSAFGGSTTHTLTRFGACSWSSPCFQNLTGSVTGYFRWFFVPDGFGLQTLLLDYFPSSATCAGFPTNEYPYFAASAPTVGPLNWSATVGAGNPPGTAGVTSITLTQAGGKQRCYWQPFVLGCFGEPIDGATVDVIQGGSTILTGTTDATGYVTPAIEYTDYEMASGVTYEVSATCYATDTGDLDCPLPDSFTLTPDSGCCCQEFEILGCLGLGVEGATVEIYSASGGTLLASGTTDSDGLVKLIWSGTCTKWVEVDHSSGRFALNAQSRTMTTESTTTITLSAATGYRCSGFCNEPLLETLEATDANGTWTLTYDAGNTNGAGWYGCATHTSMASVVTNLNPGICTKIIGTANTPYLIKVPSSGTTLVNYWGIYAVPSQEQTSATPTCSAGVLDYNATFPPSCVVGSIIQANGNATGTAASCPESLSITGTMPSTGSASTVNPGAGSITITE